MSPYPAATKLEGSEGQDLYVISNAVCQNIDQSKEQ